MKKMIYGFVIFILTFHVEVAQACGEFCDLCNSRLTCFGRATTEQRIQHDYENMLEPFHGGRYLARQYPAQTRWLIIQALTVVWSYIPPLNTVLNYLPFREHQN